MPFEQHVFISYSHLDNTPLQPEDEGWITRFHATFQALLSMRMGEKAKIWRDDKLQGNDIFADEITEQFDSTALLVSVMSPRYLDSEWCKRELLEFCEAAEERGGVVVDNKSRVLKVLKAPFDPDGDLPEIIRDILEKALGYKFFVYEDGAPLELDPAYGKEFAHNYNRKVGKLAWDASLLLESLRAAIPALGSASSPAEPSADAGPATNDAAGQTKVYLAECGRDMFEEREKLEAELGLHGYVVLPDQRLPLYDESEFVERCRESIASCDLAIQLVGKYGGVVPDGPTTKTAIELQNEIAAEASKARGLRRVIWIPEGTKSEQPAHQALIESLHTDGDYQFGADLVTGDFVELKGAIHAALKPAAPAADQIGDAVEGSGLIYLICIEADRKATVPVRKFLQAAGFDVRLPVFEGDAAAIREANQRLLRKADSVLLFYGAGDEAWKRTIDSELRKIAAYRDGEPLRARRTYVAEPKTGHKEDMIDMEEPDMILGLEGFREDAMTGFVEAMTASAGADA